MIQEKMSSIAEIGTMEDIFLYLLEFIYPMAFRKARRRLCCSERK